MAMSLHLTIVLAHVLGGDRHPTQPRKRLLGIHNFLTAERPSFKCLNALDTARRRVLREELHKPYHVTSQFGLERFRMVQCTFIYSTCRSNFWISADNKFSALRVLIVYARVNRGFSQLSQKPIKILCDVQRAASCNINFVIKLYAYVWCAERPDIPERRPNNEPALMDVMISLWIYTHGKNYGHVGHRSDC